MRPTQKQEVNSKTTNQLEDSQKETTLGLLDLIILQLLDAQPTRTKQLNEKIRKNFGVQLEPDNTIYTLSSLNNQGLVENLKTGTDEPLSPCRLTPKARNLLTQTEDSLVSASKKLSAQYSSI